MSRAIDRATGKPVAEANCAQSISQVTSTRSAEREWGIVADKGRLAEAPKRIISVARNESDAREFFQPSVCHPLLGGIWTNWTNRNNGE